jgi:hypothetical protein
MWHAIAGEGTTSSGERDADDRGTSDAPGHTSHQPDFDPREQTPLGILLRLPATWIR